MFGAIWCRRNVSGGALGGSVGGSLSQRRVFWRKKQLSKYWFTVSNPVYNQNLDYVRAAEYQETIDGSGVWVWSSPNAMVYDPQQPSGECDFQILINSQGDRQGTLKFIVDDAINRIELNESIIMSGTTGTYDAVTNIDLGTLRNGTNRLSITGVNVWNRAGIIFVVVDSNTGEVLVSSEENLMRCGNFVPKYYGD